MVERLIHATCNQWQKLLYSDVAVSMLTIITVKPPNKDALGKNTFSSCVFVERLSSSQRFKMC